MSMAPSGHPAVAVGTRYAPGSSNPSGTAPQEAGHKLINLCQPWKPTDHAICILIQLSVDTNSECSRKIGRAILGDPASASRRGIHPFAELLSKHRWIGSLNSETSRGEAHTLIVSYLVLTPLEPSKIHQANINDGFWPTQIIIMASTIEVYS